MRRIATLMTAIALVVGAVAAPWHASVAGASDVWCWDDPILEIDGELVAVDLGIRESDLGAVQSAEITVYLPEGMPARVVYIESGRIRPNVRFVYTGRPAATVPPPVSRPADSRSTIVPVTAPATVSPASGPTDIRFVVHVRAERRFDYQIAVTRYRGTLPRSMASYQAWTNEDTPIRYVLHQD
jgi:hypothetical protein